MINSDQQKQLLSIALKAGFIDGFMKPIDLLNMAARTFRDEADSMDAGQYPTVYAHTLARARTFSAMAKAWRESFDAAEAQVHRENAERERLANNYGHDDLPMDFDMAGNG